MSPSIKGIQSSHNLGRMLRLGSLGEAGAPSIENLVEGAINKEGEGALEEGAST